ncbi:hypothetical protein NIES4071_83590 [Calothrix sp. NIES-4071]|nr:hypothetical protein NIES4071_83590 [Calothrix sp. NIES-4071]BAZ62627.1 hypothetical protein NIES4105_83520 [Calothrix sp. NIES-4105]
MMTKATLDTQSPEIKRHYITQLLEKLTIDYHNTRQERKEIAAKYPVDDEEFTIIEEVELLTVNIRGYANTIKSQAKIENKQETIQRLQAMTVFNIPVIANFYFYNENYPKMKAYIRELDYLRLVLIEFLALYI